MIINRNKTIYLKNRKKHTRKGRHQRAFWTGVVAIGVILGFVFALWPNGYEVTVGDVVVGTLEDQTAVEKAKETVIAQLENKYQTGVKLEGEESIRIKKKRITEKTKITPNYLVTYMRENMDFLLEFRTLSVDGKQVGIIESEAVIDELLERLTKKYIGETEQKVEFVNKIELKSAFAKEKDLMDINELTQKALVTRNEIIAYEVGAGDTLYGIAIKHKTTVAKVVGANEGMTEKSVLSIGQKVNIEVEVPFISVKVVEAPKTKASPEVEAKPQA